MNILSIQKYIAGTSKRRRLGRCEIERQLSELTQKYLTATAVRSNFHTAVGRWSHKNDCVIEYALQESVA